LLNVLVVGYAGRLDLPSCSVCNGVRTDQTTWLCWLLVSCGTMHNSPVLGDCRFGRTYYLSLVVFFRNRKLFLGSRYIFFGSWDLTCGSHVIKKLGKVAFG
jgi:hypothetical protein